MVGLFESPTFADPQLGEFRRSRGRWRGTLPLGEATVPLVLAGSHEAPDADSLTLARTIPPAFPVWRADIAQALFEHYEPYVESLGAGEAEEPGMPRIDAAPAVWPHTRAEYVQVARLDGALTIEIGYRVDWDEEHTLGARLREGRLIELNGSVLRP
jgi:hypothetical protein